ITVCNHLSRRVIPLGSIQEELARCFKIKAHTIMDQEKLQTILDNLNITQSKTKSFLADKTVCGICQLVVKNIQRGQLPIKVLGQAVCNIYMTLSTLTINDFCEEIIKIHLPILEYIVKHSKILDPELACSVLLQNKQCYYKKPALKWTLEAPSLSTFKIPQVQYQNRKPIKILHLSDVHITPDYQIGGVTKCGYPLCCKENLGNPIFGANAGAWGDYNCDSPPWLFGQVMSYINEVHKDIDLVYFTGDVIDHTVWQSSNEENSKVLYAVFKTFYETFPNTPVLSVIGNHEAAPLNVFPPPHDGIENSGFSNQWLYSLLSKLWSVWLPEKSLRTVEKQGYYSYVVNSKWLLYDTAFFNEQLQFLSRELVESEQNEQFVHIITHVPVGNKECIEPWEVSYNNLVNRFSHIIKGQFYGHTHTDELKIFYDENHLPVNVGYNGASLTPYTKYNPNYKVIVVDPNSYDILDIDTYYFNLTEANLHPYRIPDWKKLYSMKDAYGLDNLNPISFNKVATDMFTNDTLFKQYWRFYVRDGDDSLKEGCNEQCKKELACKIITTKSLKPELSECT
ncbi:hypothetical protein NQ315_012120, partial [Exocentrus adspersus]